MVCYILKVGHHTCHISHCEINKISQNLAHLDCNSHEKFKSHRIFRPFYNRFYEEINKSHTVVVFTSFLHEKKKKTFRLNWGAPVMFKKISQNFVKSPLKFTPYLTDFSTQLMVCMGHYSLYMLTSDLQNRIFKTIALYQ